MEKNERRGRKVNVRKEQEREGRKEAWTEKNCEGYKRRYAWNKWMKKGGRNSRKGRKIKEKDRDEEIISLRS